MVMLDISVLSKSKLRFESVSKKMISVLQQAAAIHGVTAHLVWTVMLQY